MLHTPHAAFQVSSLATSVDWSFRALINLIATENLRQGTYSIAGYASARVGTFSHANGVSPSVDRTTRRRTLLQQVDRQSRADQDDPDQREDVRVAIRIALGCTMRPTMTTSSLLPSRSRRRELAASLVSPDRHQGSLPSSDDRLRGSHVPTMPTLSASKPSSQVSPRTSLPSRASLYVTQGPSLVIVHRRSGSGTPVGFVHASATRWSRQLRETAWKTTLAPSFLPGIAC